MRKNSIKSNHEEIKNLSRKEPKSINEALNFEDDTMDLGEPNDMKPMPTTPQAEKESKMRPEELINDIRKKSLRAMAELADTPEDPNYENLKRIWQLCDKAVNEKQDQREFAAKNPNLMSKQQ